MVLTEGIDPSTGGASDTDVVQRVLAGDSAGFELIMRRYNRRLYRVARGVLKDDAEAEDAVQEAYLHAFQKLASFEGKGSLSSWLAKITVNEALGRLRRADGARDAISFDVEEEKEEANYMADLISSLPTPEQSAARGEIRHLLQRAIDLLPDAYRTVFVLCGVEEMSVAETAECLDVEPATVKTRYHRARNILKENLANLVETNAAEVFPFDGERCDRIVFAVLKRLKE